MCVCVSFFSIDISLDRAIKITCPTQKILVCISDTATKTVVFHPNGRIYQNDMRTDLVAFDGLHQNNLLRFVPLNFENKSHLQIKLISKFLWICFFQICKNLAERHKFHGKRRTVGVFGG